MHSQNLAFPIAKAEEGYQAPLKENNPPGKGKDLKSENVHTQSFILALGSWLNIQISLVFWVNKSSTEKPRLGIAFANPSTRMKAELCNSLSSRKRQNIDNAWRLGIVFP
ncbi:uncharacterized protein G2W53_039856 [Senna tora]|uniref:Uncharacterized protein n=1 Tax=Senna tora TaxID=362788 RepID=A0A834W372_9FABA|nr:uncharacterized protein G2W53_039856 [Senna tora]